MLEVINEKKLELHDLCEKFDVKTMYLFGSATSSDFNNSSDIDLLITFEELPFDRYTDNYFDLHEALEKLFSRKVDLLTERSLKNRFFIERVENTKQLVYAA